MDQATPSDQAVLRNLGECGEDLDMDRENSSCSILPTPSVPFSSLMTGQVICFRNNPILNHLLTSS
jgi:hypothetical protein